MLYNFDFASALLGRFFYPHGISTNPTQVFIGKDDWLYLGEQYEKTVTSRRHQPTVQDAELARMIAGATTSWDQWLNLKGVSMFRVMLGPGQEHGLPRVPAGLGATGIQVYHRYITGKRQQGALR